MTPRVYYDVNGDGLVTAGDVIDVIDQINSRAIRAGEGETSDSAGPVDQGLANAAPITVPRHSTTDQSVPWVIEDSPSKARKLRVRTAVASPVTDAAADVDGLLP